MTKMKVKWSDGLVWGMRGEVERKEPGMTKSEIDEKVNLGWR